MRAIDRHAPPALSEAVRQLYRACHLTVPTTIVAADMVTFTQLLGIVRRPLSVGTTVMAMVYVALPGVLAGVVLAIGKADLVVAVSLLPLAVILLVAIPGPSIGEFRTARRARADIAAAFLLAGGGALLAGAATGSASVGGVAFAALVSLFCLTWASVQLNGGLPGRLGLAWHVAGIPLAGTRPVNRIVRDRLNQAGADLRARPGFVAPPRPEEGDARPRQRLRQMLERRLSWAWLDHEPILGRLVPAHVRLAVLEAGGVADPPVVLRAALAVDQSCDAAVFLDRVAVVLARDAAALPTARGRLRPSRDPYAAILALLNAGAVWWTLIALAPSERLADRLLARLIADDPDPALRFEAIELLGFARFFAALGMTPVDRGPEGELFVVGSAAAPIAVVRVLDVAGRDGTRAEHWLPVPPYVATAREAVAWTFGKSEHDYRR